MRSKATLLQHPSPPRAPTPELFPSRRPKEKTWCLRCGSRSDLESMCLVSLVPTCRCFTLITTLMMIIIIIIIIIITRPIIILMIIIIIKIMTARNLNPGPWEILKRFLKGDIPRLRNFRRVPLQGSGCLFWAAMGALRCFAPHLLVTSTTHSVSHQLLSSSSSSSSSFVCKPSMRYGSWQRWPHGDTLDPTISLAEFVAMCSNPNIIICRFLSGHRWRRQLDTTKSQSYRLWTRFSRLHFGTSAEKGEFVKICGLLAFVTTPTRK